MGVDWITEDPARVGSVFRVYETIVLWARDGARGHPRARRLRRVHRCADQWWCQADDPAPRVVTRLHFHFASSTSSSLLSSPLLVLKITGVVVIIERTYSRYALYWIPSDSVCFDWYLFIEFSFIICLYLFSFGCLEQQLLWTTGQSRGRQNGVVLTGVVRVRWRLFLRTNWSPSSD